MPLVALHPALRIALLCVCVANKRPTNSLPSVRRRRHPHVECFKGSVRKSISLYLGSTVLCSRARQVGVLYDFCRLTESPASSLKSSRPSSLTNGAKSLLTNLLMVSSSGCAGRGSATKPTCAQHWTGALVCLHLSADAAVLVVVVVVVFIMSSCKCTLCLQCHSSIVSR